MINACEQLVNSGLCLLLLNINTNKLPAGLQHFVCACPDYQALATLDLACDDTTNIHNGLRLSWMGKGGLTPSCRGHDSSGCKRDEIRFRRN